MTRTAATSGPVDKNKIVYQSARGANLHAVLPLCNFPDAFSSGSTTGRTPNATNTMVGLWGVVVPHDFRCDEIKMYLKEQGGGTTKIDVHKGSDASITPTTVFTTQGNRPSIAVAVSLASGSVGVSDAIPDTTLWNEDDTIFVYVDEQGTGPSGLYVTAVGRYDILTA